MTTHGNDDSNDRHGRTPGSEEGRIGVARALAIGGSLLPASGIRRRTMRFGEDQRQIVTAFVPHEPQPGPWVFFLFGGDWTSGSPKLWSFAGNWFARHGIPAVLGGYRLAPEHVFPAQLEDALAGFAFSRFHAEELGIAGRRSVLSGASSGGHLAAMAAISCAREEADSDRAGAPGCADGLLVVNAPLDLPTAHTPKGVGAVEALTGHARPWPDADPLAWLTAEPISADAFPRTLVVQGRGDELVPPAAADHFVDALEAMAPGRSQILRPPWSVHVDLVNLYLDRDAETSGAVREWLGSFVG